MTAEQLKTINQLYVDLWHLVRDHHNAKSDAEWDVLAEQAEELTKKYGGEVQQLVLDTLELIERNYQASIKGMSQYKLDPPIYRKE